MSEIEHGLLSLGSGPAVDGVGRAERKHAFHRHCHGNSIERALRAKTRNASCRYYGILPLCGSFGSEDPQCGSGDEVALKVKGVVNRTVQAEEALGGSSRLEPLQFALASSDCLMRILRPMFFRSPCSCRQVSRRRRNAAA
jgi:hypothetical protein